MKAIFGRFMDNIIKIYPKLEIYFHKVKYMN